MSIITKVVYKRSRKEEGERGRKKRTRKRRKRRRRRRQGELPKFNVENMGNIEMQSFIIYNYC